MARNRDVRSMAAVAAAALSMLTTASVDAAHSGNIRFQHLDPRDGLSQTVVYAIAQDVTGFMWFGTQEGLNRFDGYEFVVHAPERGTADSIPDESIRALLVGQDGTLWIATDAGGLARYDAVSESFAAYRHDPGQPGSLGDDRIRALFEDSKGRLWVGTDGAGLDLLNRDTDSFSHFRHDPEDATTLSGNHVWSIAEDRQGLIWVASTEGLNRFDPDTGTFTRYRHDPADTRSLSDDETRVVYVDRQGNVWAGTASGLNRYDGNNNAFERFHASETDPYSLSANRINTLFQDDTGVLWIGTVDGLNAWNPSTRQFHRYQHDPADPYSLPHDTIMSVNQDRAGVLWVGSYSGVSRWNPATRAMRLFRHDPALADGLSDNTITSFAEDPTGNILVGTFGGGINVLDRIDDGFVQIVHDPDDATSLSSNRVMALLYDRQGNLWAGTRASGLNRRQAGSQRFDRFTHDPDDENSLSANGVTDLLEDRNGGIWVATFGGGINYFNGSRFKRFLHDPDDAATLSSDRILVLHEDSTGGIWAGTYDAGLNLLDPATGRITRIKADVNNPDGLRGDSITMIRESGDGDLWIGVKDEGLHCWTRENRRAGTMLFDHFSELHGLPSSTIYSGQWDTDGHLWLSTGRGLSRFDPNTREFRNLDSSYGLQGEEFNLSAGFRAENGELFFGGMKGFNAFQPTAVEGKGLAPAIVITELMTFNEPFDISDHRETGDPVALRYDDDVISIEFAALDYASPRATRYEYRLDGVDSGWVDGGKRRHVTYNKLPAGLYEFQVRAINGNGVLSERIARLPLAIASAPWASVWAYSGYAVLLTFLLLFFARAQANRVRQAARIRHAEEVHRLQGRLTSAQQIANVGNWELDLDRDELWWSDQVYRVLDVDPNTFAVTYATFLERIHPDDRNMVDTTIHDAINRLESFAIDHRVVLADGSVRFVTQRGQISGDRRGLPTRVAATLHDISDRKAAENAVREQADFQELLARLSALLLDARPDAIDDTVRNSLGIVAERYALEAIDVSWFTTDRLRLVTSHRWSRLSSSKKRNGDDTRRAPWSTKMLLAGEDVLIPDIDDMPDEGAKDETLFRRLGIQSLLMIPLSVEADRSGACRFINYGSKREWPDEIVAELRLVADVFASAIARHRAIEEVMHLKDQLQAENLYLREEVKLAHGFSGIIGEDPVLKRCLRAVEKVAPTDVAVLVLGETGTGKELIARAIHKLSSRADGPMISVNCPALPGNLIESELFGHEKGAFTGADSRRKGRFEIAEGGTIFLDEIGELPMDLQAKLLRVLQTGEFERLGGTETLHANVRLVAATNRNLPESIKNGEFRSDLYFRINSFPIVLPPLRDRKGDIPALAEFFVHKHAERLHRKVVGISARLLKKLQEYDWPGNVRELESTIERALISSTDTDLLDLDEPLNGSRNDGNGHIEIRVREGSDLKEIERTYILAVLEKTRGQVGGPGGAAERLGLPASTLRSKMKKLGIERD